MNDRIPTAWATATLRDLVGPNGMFTDGDWILSEHLRTGNDVRLIQLADVGVGRFLNKSQKFISKTTAEELRVTYLREGDVLISRMADPLARACLLPQLEQPAITAVDIAIARPDQSVSSPQFVMHLCNSHLILNQAEAVAVGTTRKRISRKNLESLSVPVPPLNEQRRIVAKLEKLLSRVDAAQARLATIPRILKRFRQSVLAAACSGRLTADWRRENPGIESAADILKRLVKEREGLKVRKPKRIAKADELEAPFDLPTTWSFCRLEDIAAAKPNAIKAGPFGSSLTKACYVPSGFKVYGQEQVINGDPNFGDYYISEEKFHELQSCQVSAGDILVSLVGTIGRVLVVPEDFQRGIINPRLAKFSLHESIVREFIANYLVSPLAKNILTEQSHGGTMEILNLGIMRALPIPLAPLAEQQEIVRRVEALFKTADALEARYRKAKAHVDKLTQSILAKAFRGELVITEAELARRERRDYEPASVLIERLNQERAPKAPKLRLVGRSKKVAAPPIPHSPRIFYRRAALDCYVLQALQGDPNLGRTKIEKITHLIESHCGIDLEREPLRDAAGPNDFPSRMKLESLARKLNWYSTSKVPNDSSVRYRPGPKIAESRRTAAKLLGKKKESVDALLSMMRPLDTNRSEIVATLYAAWNDLLLAGKKPSDADIIDEILNNWHARKQRFSRQRWLKGLIWMREKGLIPKGTGKPVAQKPHK